jgi:predicted membrane protein
MFLAIVFIVIGIFLLLNAMGIIVSANFWTLLWAIIFIALGLKMLARKNACPLCHWGVWKSKIENCDCGHHHNSSEK